MVAALHYSGAIYYFPFHSVLFRKAPYPSVPFRTILLASVHNIIPSSIDGQTETCSVVWQDVACPGGVHGKQR